MSSGPDEVIVYEVPPKDHGDLVSIITYPYGVPDNFFKPGKSYRLVRAVKDGARITLDFTKDHSK